MQMQSVVLCSIAVKRNNNGKICQGKGVVYNAPVLHLQFYNSPTLSLQTTALVDPSRKHAKHANINSLLQVNYIGRIPL